MIVVMKLQLNHKVMATFILVGFLWVCSALTINQFLKDLIAEHS